MKGCFTFFASFLITCFLLVIAVSQLVGNDQIFRENGSDSSYAASSSDFSEQAQVGYSVNDFKADLLPVIAGEPKDWTIIVYMLGDNNLEYSSIMDFIEMEEGYSDNLNILVLWDRPKNGWNFMDNSGHAKLYRIRKADYTRNNDYSFPVSIVSEELKDYGEN